MLFEVKNIPPVAWAIAHMNPVVAILIDELVKWKVEFADEVEQPFVVLWPVADSVDVGGLAKKVLT